MKKLEEARTAVEKALRSKCRPRSMALEVAQSPRKKTKVLPRRLPERTMAAARKLKRRMVATERMIVFIRADFRHPVKRRLRMWRGLGWGELDLNIVVIVVGFSGARQCCFDGCLGFCIE